MKQSNNSPRSQRGFGIIEIIVAVSIFVIIAATGTITVLHAFSVNRLGDEETEATLFAQEGIEAVRSIKNQDWNNLTTGIYGLSNLSDSWVFSGLSNTAGKFTREVVVSEVQRDGSGDIVESAGVVDDDTRRITSTVTWNFSPARSNLVELATYLTNFKKPIGPTVTPTPTGTPTVTPTPELTATPTPGVVTCLDYCQGASYSTGICRQNSSQCGRHDEVYESAGDSYCSGGAAADTCCCAP